MQLQWYGRKGTPVIWQDNTGQPKQALSPRQYHRIASGIFRIHRLRIEFRIYRQVPAKIPHFQLKYAICTYGICSSYLFNKSYHFIHSVGLTSTRTSNIFSFAIFVLPFWFPNRLPLLHPDLLNIYLILVYEMDIQRLTVQGIHQEWRLQQWFLFCPFH